ncbi:MAG TPA: neutral zinc metallopeptidase [Sphingorhabdus lacus]|jgi:predicted metalloprotease|uniref:KPN_02809 family neutral zinc metallopeptidase n=1 Tax=Sphingorhabdus lacus TaxID=392610 RepID=UPI002CEB10E8|nr:neutral zinc metallopeptidase [Sphingorhabdus lacus]HPV67253.1 neutral zinc metallopeptidase [Sphingorhabdus lacus]
MRLDDLDPSGNVSDQGSGGGGFGGGGGGGMLGLVFSLLPMLLGRKMGCGSVLLIAVVGYFVISSGMLTMGGPVSAPGTSQQSSAGNVACDTQEELFACRVLKSTEDTWGKLLRDYRPAKLTFYQGGGQSGCGAAQSAMGPFYCPSDEGIYLDTSFFEQMDKQMGAGGDFAYAYVVAHEVGHHVQNLAGIANQVRKLQAQSSQTDGNRLQVGMELQADCFAGVWAGINSNRIEPGDIEEGMRAANAIGDDTLMQQAGRAPVESMFTHGTSEQRMEALQRGIRSKNPNACNYLQGLQ